MDPIVSIIVPVYNAEETLSAVHRERFKPGIYGFLSCFWWMTAVRILRPGSAGNTRTGTGGSG